MSEAVRDDRAVDRCPVCGGDRFYARKDFDPKTGLTVVVIGAAISAGFYWFGRDLVAYGILGGAALVDLIVYRHLKGDGLLPVPPNSGGACARTGRFDLHTAGASRVQAANRTTVDRGAHFRDETPKAA